MIHHAPKPNSYRRHFVDSLKNGVITGAADDDPSGIITYTQTGATFGFSLLWLIVWATPLLIATEQLASRVAITTKTGMAKLIRDRFGLGWATVAVSILLISNVLTIGADIAAVGEIMGLWTNTPASLWSALIGLVLLLTLLRGGYQVVTKLIFIMTPLLMLYVISGLLAHPHWADVLLKSVPHIPVTALYLSTAVALLGTTISPYLVFWQATEELEEGKTVRDLKTEDRSVAWGMIYSNLISFFIIVAAAATLHTAGISVASAKEAALALKPIAGQAAFLFYSLGILFGGLVGVPVLAGSAAYALAELFNWHAGLDAKEWQAEGFYGTILLVIIASLVMAASGYSPLVLVIFSQVVQGALMPILIFFLLKLAQDPKVVGNYKPAKLTLWLARLAMLTTGAFALLMVASFLLK